MGFDASRFSFDPWKDFAGVVMQQGRVQLDSDWNEGLAIMNRRIQAGTMDTVGRAVYPLTTPFGFKIGASTDANGAYHVTIGAGRMYVDGLLVENHGLPAQAQWDPALAELSGAPQESPGAPEQDLDFTQQPYYPGAALPTGDGPFLVYLDVWQRDVTFLEDPNLVEKAVGVDTTGRIQMVWQVKLLGVSSDVTCATLDASIPAWEALIAPPAARLTTGVAQTGTPGPCCLTPNTGYTGRENQLYRVEIHQGGGANTSGTGSSLAATFKWSRDNASVETGVTTIVPATTKTTNVATSLLTVESTGRDDVLGFSPGNWIEITDDVRELNGQAGDLRQIDVDDGVDKTNRTIRLSAPVSADIQAHLTAPPANYPNCHTRIRRWDQGGKVYESDGTKVWVDLNAASAGGDIPVPPTGTRLILEDGVTVSFDLSPSNGSFRVGDFWTFAARTSDGSVEPLAEAPPQGIHHHYARLAVLRIPNPPSDCRIPWPPATPGVGETCACTVCVEVADYVKNPAAIADAIAKVNAMGGGRVCLGPGTFPLGANAVKMVGLANVTLSGQGPATILAFTGAGPAVIVDTCRAQRIEDLSIVALPVVVFAPSQEIPIGLMVRNSGMVALERCSIQAPATVGPIVSSGSAPSNGVAMAAVSGAAIALDGPVVAATFRDNLLVADLGIAALAALAAAGKTTGSSNAPALPPLALAACSIQDNLMFCPIAGVVLGDATAVQGLYVYLLENAIDANTVVGGQLAGIFIEGFTDPGASVRISRNDLEVKNVGIDVRLDGVIIADNVITQADLATGLPGAAAGIGIALRGIANSKLPPFAARVHRNRIAGIAGCGILLGAPLASLSILDNTIEKTVGYGITMGDQASDLLIRGNEIRNVTGAGALGIHALALNAVVENNALAAISNAPGAAGTTIGIAVAGASATAVGNHIRDVGPTDTAGPPIYGIYARALDELNLSTNVLQQASSPVAQNFAANFIGLMVEVKAASPSVTVSLQDNVVEGSSFQPLIEVTDGEAGRAECVITGNQCHRATPSELPIVSIAAATAIVGNNRVQGKAPVSSVRVQVTRTSSGSGGGATPAATIVGNLVSGPILLNKAALPSPWAPLNLVV
jgi:hypothetical protein